MKKPNCFIVGAPRCGTTSLWTYLRGHPEIFMAAQKELYFFDSDLWEDEPRAPSLGQYLLCFSAAGEQKKRLGDATPSYLRSQLAPRAIKAFGPESQIIIMLRNPVDVMYSLHSLGRRYNTEPIVDFETALEADRKRNGARSIGYREFTDYPKQVQRYFDVFGRENVHVIIFDDLKENPVEVYRNTLRFLRVSPSFMPTFAIMDANRHVRNFRLQRVVVRPSQAFQVLARTLMPPRLRGRIRRTLLNLNTVVRARPPMDPELRRRLQSEFEPKVDRLSRLLRRDLSGWYTDLDDESPAGADRSKHELEIPGTAT